MICWLLGWQHRVTINNADKGEVVIWKVVVYGAIPDLLPGEPCKPTLVSPHKEEVTCARCRKAHEKRGANAIDSYLKKLGLE